MANNFLTIDMITREAVMLFRNSNNFIKNIGMQYDKYFAKDGAKIGSQLRIRLPNDYIVADGPAASVQDTQEQSTALVVATQRHVDIGFSTAERTLKVDDFNERILMPMCNNLAGNVASTIIGGTDPGICNIVSNLDANGNIITPNQNTFLKANATLTANSAPQGKRNLVVDPFTNANTAGVLSGLLNPVTEISRQFMTGQMKNGLGFTWMEDPTVIKHTTGTFSAGTVNGASQTGLTLITNAITGTLKIGDIITIAGVNGVNRVTKVDTGQLRQFVVTAAAISGATQISIYPALVPAVGGNAVQYQTVVTSPANSAAISLATPASSTYVRNFGYAPEAITMVTADLVRPTKSVEESSQQNFDGLSLRMLTGYLIGTDQLVTRLDILFGYTFIRPEWCCVVCDAVPT